MLVGIGYISHHDQVFLWARKDNTDLSKSVESGMPSICDIKLGVDQVP